MTTFGSYAFRVEDFRGSPTAGREDQGDWQGSCAAGV